VLSTLAREAGDEEETVRISAFCVGVCALAWMTGCAPTSVSVPSSPATTAASKVAATGRILSMRKVTGQNSSAPWRTVLLADAGAAHATDNSDSALTEFIVHRDDGATISVVQSNDAGFRTGDRVVILRDDRTHLERPG
jgi:outer membrane lipoprotein SlyB